MCIAGTQPSQANGFLQSYKLPVAVMIPIGGGGGLAIALTGATGERVTITALQRASNADGRLASTKSGAAYKVAVKTVTIAADGTASVSEQPASQL